jgi:hypothetical protein
MDKKISELVAATSVLATDVLPLVTGNVNKKVSVATLTRAIKSPSYGEVLFNPANPLVFVDTIPLTFDVIAISDNPNHVYILPAGVPGQSLTVYATQTTELVYTNTTTIFSFSFSLDGLAELIFINGIWRVKSSSNVAQTTTPR